MWVFAIPQIHNFAPRQRGQLWKGLVKARGHPARDRAVVGGGTGKAFRRKTSAKG